MKILIVDDEELSLQVLKVVLADSGHEVVSAPDGDAGWRVFVQHRPSVVISDWRMPKITGLELCQKVRKAGGPHYTYFILLTGNEATGENYRKAVEAEIDDFLSKPAKQDEIEARLRVADRVLRLTRRVEDLERLIPICAYCKEVRSQEGIYEPVEDFISRHAKATFTHGICPKCLDKSSSGRKPA